MSRRCQRCAMTCSHGEVLLDAYTTVGHCDGMREAMVPEWTLGWRLQRALGFADVTVETMAAELGVSRATISRWCHDIGAPPRTIYLRAWAARCQVSYDWLLTGTAPLLPRRDSDPQPAGWSRRATDRGLSEQETDLILRDWKRLIRRHTFETAEAD